MKVLIICQDKLIADDIFGVIKDMWQRHPPKKFPLDGRWVPLIWHELESVNVVCEDSVFEKEIAQSIRDYLVSAGSLSRRQVRIADKIED